MRLRFRTACSGLACALLVSLGCQKSPPSTAPPNVLLIVVDTLRWDRLGCYGNQRGLTPFLDRLSARGFRFHQAYAASSWTRPSVASIFTSRYPSQHGAVTILNKIDDQELTLAKVLKELGYATGAVSGSPIISAASGFAQGFDRFDEFPWRDKVRVDPIKARALAWLDRVWPSSGKPVFLYLHLMEPHGPYKPPEPYHTRFRRGPRLSDAMVNRKLMRAWGEFMKRGNAEGFRQFNATEIAVMASLYDGEVASLDAELEHLFQELDRRRFLDNAVVVITSDHGEEFYEHGGTWHGVTLYNETIQVPLLVVPPGDGGARPVEGNVSLVDVAPTILELLHAPAPPAFEGHSFARRIERRSWLGARWTGFWETAHDDVEALSELELSGGHPKALPKHTRALVRRSLKVLTQPGGGTESYDLAQDPGEQRPNLPALAESSAALLDELRRRYAQLAERASPPAESFELDDATKDRLRALGYAVDAANGGR